LFPQLGNLGLVKPHPAGKLEVLALQPVNQLDERRNINGGGWRPAIGGRDGRSVRIVAGNWPSATRRRIGRSGIPEDLDAAEMGRESAMAGNGCRAGRAGSRG
jgi:hypothetical protein